MRVSELPIYGFFGDWKGHTNIPLRETRIVWKLKQKIFSREQRKLVMGLIMQKPHLQVLSELSTVLMGKWDWHSNSPTLLFIFVNIGQNHHILFLFYHPGTCLPTPTTLAGASDVLVFKITCSFYWIFNLGSISRSWRAISRMKNVKYN